MKLMQTIQRADVALFRWCTRLRYYQEIIRISRLLSKTGDGPLYVVLGAGLLLSGEPTARLWLYSGILAFAVERPLYLIVKNGFKRNRPADALGDFRSHVIPSDRFSFPSGHTSAAFLMATLMSNFLPAATAPAYLWASLVGMSRVFLGVHFPSDILMGMAMGTVIAQTSIEVLTP